MVVVTLALECLKLDLRGQRLGRVLQIPGTQPFWRWRELPRLWLLRAD
jgi:hypothetical protein